MEKEQGSTSSMSDTDEENTLADRTNEHKILTVLLMMFIRDNINTPQKVDKIVRCAINYCRGQACIPLHTWRNEFEIMKKDQFADIYTKYIHAGKDLQYHDYNLKKLFEMAIRFDNEDEHCKELFYQEFPELNREYRKQIKEQKRQEEDTLREQKKNEKERRREEKQNEKERLRQEKEEAKEEVELEKQRKYEDMKDDFEEYNFKCNDQFYTIDEGKLQIYNKQGFTTKYQNYRIDKKISFLDYWLIDANIREYRCIDFVPPPLKCKSDTFNTWDLKEVFDDDMINDEVDSSIFYTFFKYVCGNDEVVYEYFIKYFAHMLQFPAIKPQSALFFTGSHGGGKDTLILILKKLMGVQSVMVEVDPENVFGKFNLRRMNKLLVCLQESESLKHYNAKIKDLITCEIATLADKGIKSNPVNDFTRLIIFSNEENIIKIEPSDRRFVIIKTYDFHYDPKPELFSELYKAINDPECIIKLRNELLNYSVEQDYHFQRNRPITEIYKDLKEANTPSIIRWAWELTNIDSEEITTITNLCASYNEWCKQTFEGSNSINVKSFGLNLKKFFNKNGQWIGFEKIRRNTGIKYKVNPPQLKDIIENTYGYVGEI